MKSIEKQLNLYLGLGLVLVFGLFWWLTVWSIHQLTEHYMLERLKLDAQEIQKHLYFNDQKQILLPEFSLNPAYMQINSGLYYEIKAPSGHLHSSSLGSFLFAKPGEGPQDQPFHYETAGPVEKKILVFYYPIVFQGEPVQIYVAEDHVEIEQTLDYFDAIMLAFFFVTLVMLYVMQKTLLRLGFERLRPMYIALDSATANRRLHLEPEHYPVEVVPLVNKVNEAWQRLQVQFERSRQSNADMAHALKTPLQLLFQLSEHPTIQQDPQLKKALEEQTNRIYSRLETELKKAQLAGDTPGVTRFSLLNDLPDLKDSLSQLYPDKECILDVSQAKDCSELPLEQQDGFELLGNLLDNAAKFSHRQYRLTLKCHPGSEFECTIEDDGPGIDPTEVEYIQTRGGRLDETKPGHGLGLAIVKQLLEAYGGKIEFHSESNAGHYGGLRVTVVLPSTPTV